MDLPPGPLYGQWITEGPLGHFVFLTLRDRSVIYEFAMDRPSALSRSVFTGLSSLYLSAGWMQKRDPMAIESRVAGLALVAASVVMLPVAHAEAPYVSSRLWVPPALTLGECLRRARDAMREVGSADAKQEVKISKSVGIVSGTLGDFVVQISCLTGIRIVIVAVAGPNSDTAGSYTSEILKKISKKGGRR